MALTKQSFLKGREEGKNGLAGYLSQHLRGWGTVTVVSGQTAIVTSDTDIAATDIIIASPLTKGTNAAYIVGTSISAATSFTITVSADPGSGGCVIAFLIIRP